MAFPTEPVLWLIAATSSLAAIIVAARASLRGWEGWLALRRLEIEQRRGAADDRSVTAGSRIELADLKERVRRLEAIAAGVDL